VYEKTFEELQVLDTQTRDLVAQARYLSGLDANTKALTDRIEKVRKEGEEARHRIRVLESELGDRRRDLDELAGNLPEPGRLTEDVRALAAGTDGRGLRAAALARSVEVMEEVIQGYQSTHLDRVAERAGTYFSEFTQGRYTGVSFDGAYEPEVLSAEGATAPSSLSRVVRDQLHLAIRLAVNAEVGGDRSLPLVLDEAFIGWDDGRLQQAERDLCEIEEGGGQVITLSSDPRVAVWGSHQISLSEEDGRRAA
jgi:uncharacterized protein YhaN